MGILLQFPFYVVIKYFQICEDWRKKKYDENIIKEEINFKKLIKELHKDFEQTIRNAKEIGEFEEDDVRYKIICK